MVHSRLILHLTVEALSNQLMEEVPSNQLMEEAPSSQLMEETPNNQLMVARTRMLASHLNPNNNMADLPATLNPVPHNLTEHQPLQATCHNTVTVFSTTQNIREAYMVMEEVNRNIRSRDRQVGINRDDGNDLILA